VDQPTLSDLSHNDIRTVRGVDQTLTVDPAKLQLLFQGALQSQKGEGYGAIPWKLGMLTPVTANIE